MPATTAAPSRADVLAWARDIYETGVDRKDARKFASAFTKDAWLRFGNNPRLEGRDAIEAAIAQFFTAMIDLKHSSKGSFMDGDTLFLEAEVTYTRHDRQKVTVPAMTVFHLAGTGADGKPVADNCRIYVDLAPLFAP
jgi:uncharacterized protein (TIGR02246 family)